MCAGFAQLKKISKEIKDIVNGWIRITGKELKFSKQIPSIVNAMCIILYGESEHFSTTSPVIKCSNQNTLISYRSNNTNSFGHFHACYGATIIPSEGQDKYKWNLTVHKLNVTNRAWRRIFIGVTSSSENITEYIWNVIPIWQDNWYILDDRGMLEGMNHRGGHAPDGKQWLQDSKFIQSNDKISVILDLKYGQISFYLNSDLRGNFSRIIQTQDTQYRLAIMLEFDKTLQEFELQIDNFQICTD